MGSLPTSRLLARRLALPAQLPPLRPGHSGELGDRGRVNAPLTHLDGLKAALLTEHNHSGPRHAQAADGFGGVNPVVGDVGHGLVNLYNPLASRFDVCRVWLGVEVGGQIIFNSGDPASDLYNLAIRNSVSCLKVHRVADVLLLNFIFHGVLLAPHIQRGVQIAGGVADVP